MLVLPAVHNKSNYDNGSAQLGTGGWGRAPMVIGWFFLFVFDSIENIMRKGEKASSSGSLNLVGCIEV